MSLKTFSSRVLYSSLKHGAAVLGRTAAAAAAAERGYYNAGRPGAFGGAAHVRVVDLRSDTVTKPGPAMRQAMAEAVVGDDVMGEDPTVNGPVICPDLCGRKSYNNMTHSVLLIKKRESKI